MQYTISEFGFRMAHDSTVEPDAHTFMRHAHPEYEILYFISGEADCIVEHLCHTMRPGEIALIPPMAYHLIALTGNATYERLVIDFADCGLPPALLERVFTEPRVIDTHDMTELYDVIKRMDDYAVRFSGEISPFLARNLTAELVCLIDTSSVPSRSFSKFSRTMEEAMRYIDAHIDTIRGLEELCAHLYISRAYLHRLFHASLGISPMRYITDKRLLLAQSRLRLGEKPTQVYRMCGFGDYSSFYRAYRTYFGIAPADENPPGQEEGL